MKEYGTSDLRNVALVGHGGVGKTSLGEALLFAAGATTRQGRVEDGTTTLDCDADEISRKISINTSVAFLEWEGCKVNLVDTPGYADFAGDVVSALHAVDAGLLAVQAPAGVEVGTERVWKYVQEHRLPCLVFVTKMKKENSDFGKCVQALRENLGINAVPIVLPVGSSEGFRGVLDLLRMRFHEGGGVEGPIPEESKAEAERAREKVVEAAAESSDELTSKYLEEGVLTAEEMMSGLREGIRRAAVVPVLCGDSLAGTGVIPLLGALRTLLPSAAERPPVRGRKGDGAEEIERVPRLTEPLCAYVFKTQTEPHAGVLNFFRVFSGAVEGGKDVYNSTKERSERIGQVFCPRGKERLEAPRIVAGDIGVVLKLKETTTADTFSEKPTAIVLPPIEFPKPSISLAIEPKTRGDEEKVSNGLTRLHDEDPTFTYGYLPEIKQTLVSGLGELHLEVTMARLKRKFGVEVNLLKPKIPYRETIRQGKVEVQGRYKRQTGGRGQFGDVWIRVDPLPRGSGFEFEDAIVGGVIPSGFIPSVEKGVKGAMEEGILAGYPVTDLRVTLFDGSHHPVDSSNMAFEIAGSLAIKKAVMEAKPVLLEPIMTVSVSVPDEFVGAATGDLNSRRGRIVRIDTGRGVQTITATVAQAELYKYSTQLRSLTQGRGTYSMEFSHYEEVPPDIAERIVAETKREKEEKD